MISPFRMEMLPCETSFEDKSVTRDTPTCAVELLHLLHESTRKCVQYSEKIRKVPIIKQYRVSQNYVNT